MDSIRHPRFLVLCRYPNQATESLRKVFGKIGEVEVVCDEESTSRHAVWIGDEQMTGFEGLSRWSLTAPAVSAWERAWKYIAEQCECFPDGVWLVEDDVAGSYRHLEQLVQTTMQTSADLAAIEFRQRPDDGHWPHWGHAASHFDNPCRSFNPLCFLSARLIGATCDFRDRNGGFIFQEVLFASLASRLEMKVLDWMESPLTHGLFGRFRYRPEVTIASPGISHPVKDRQLHARICAALVDAVPSASTEESG